MRLIDYQSPHNMFVNAKAQVVCLDDATADPSLILFFPSNNFIWFHANKLERMKGV